MAMPLVAGGKPGGVGLIETFYTAPVKECSRIKKDEQPNAGHEDHCKIDIIPALPDWPRVRRPVDRVRNPQHRHGNQCATDMDDISLLRQNHTGHSHADAPKVIRRSKLPKTEQAENEQHREEYQPHFVDRVAPVENETGRDRHGQRRHATDASSDERLEFHSEPNAGDAYEHDGEA